MSSTGKGRPGGVLPISAAATKKTASSQSSKSTPRAPGARLRLIIRRLPPGLTETEFWYALGEEWQVGKGRVEWAAYKDGKVSKDLAKPSRPARAYLKAKDPSALEALSARIKEATFNDARNTARDTCLLGPPLLEFAPYSKMAGNRVRHDGRQGTIDQDQEFIDFLQSLTEPITKAVPNGMDSSEPKPEKVTTTPLVQYLKEKKANKAKEGAQSKGTKGGKESKSIKNESKSTIVMKGAPSTGNKTKVVKSTQETAKISNKSVPVPPNKQGQQKLEAKPAAKEPPSQPAPAKRERDKTNASAVARMLQRDLGLTPKPPRASRVASSAASEATKAASPTLEKATPVTKEPKSTPATPPTAPAATTGGSRNNRTPSAALSKSASSTGQNPSSAPAAATPGGTSSGTVPPQRPAKASPQPSAGAKSAFLKHANPSQGITEELLKAAFEGFGIITRCEIDKKKGLGYIDFGDTESLRKAMTASPVKVANGQVVVLENRSQQARRGPQVSSTTPTAPKGAPAATNASSAASAPRSATTPQNPPSNLSSPTPKPATPAAAGPIAETIPAAAAPPTAPPTAPRGANRGGGRGANRGAAHAGRGNIVSNHRGLPRAGHRGGRGNFAGRGNRGGESVSNTTTAANTGEAEAVSTIASAPATDAK